MKFKLLLPFIFILLILIVGFVFKNYAFLAVKNLEKGNLAFQNMDIENAGFLEIVKIGY